ncbi:glycoside hydrolase family 73 protein [Brevibacillus ruminantium]|uniref:Glycoside hydrolase family 73 protein n=1 Tax=Brevibacillus ruminantium TaxID=2950604 RepID=A0ABY4WK48_9BACL|nr:glycoside hydrolase family 73 protein [Brevibacillus ruminantium]USG67462.1 glycoside hydrolase family 73 protein [Brevibacillus ruminantium]
MSQQTFITKVADPAMANMKKTGIPASLTIAQAILESAWGTSGLTQKANNLFGMKGTGPAGSVQMPTKEYQNGKMVELQAAFRKYHTWAESIEDHASLILNGTRDKPTRYHGVLGADYKVACQAIWKGGYATDPNYPDKLIALIEKYQLHRYDDIIREEEKNAIDKDSTKKNPVEKTEVEKHAAEKVIAVLGAIWTASADKQVQAAAHYAANALRKAAGIL